MLLKDKRTGKLIGTDGFVVQAPTAAMSLETFAEQYEIAPEAEKPFEEVAEASFSVFYGGVNDKAEVAYGKGAIKIADRDYYEILPDGTKKTEFTWDEAMKIEKKTNGKWRLPTEQEWFAICAVFGGDEDGKITGETLAKNLNLTTGKYDSGYFWSRTAGGTVTARYLFFGDTYVFPQDNVSKTSRLSVRLVRGGEE